ncbi:7540_t:CDS:2, partial [Racocetra persica]
MSGISWSKLTLNELKDLCMSCGLSSVRNKEDLSDRLQAYFGKNKGKATDKSGVEDEEDLDDIIEVPRFDANERDWNDERDADLEVDDVRAYSQEADNRIKDELVGRSRGREKAEQITVDMFLSAMGKIEMKIERNFSALYREIEECDLLDETWPKVSLSKPCDQHEYDFLAKIGKRLDKAIKVVPTVIKKDLNTLQIVGSNDKMIEKYKDRIPLFSQSGAASRYYSQISLVSHIGTREKDIPHLRLIQKEMKVIRVKGGMIETFNPFMTKEPSGSQNIKEFLTASTVEALDTSPPAAPPQVLEPLPSQRMETNYTQTPFSEECLVSGLGKAGSQVSVVGRMQSAEALSYWQDKIGPSLVVISWLKNGVLLFSRGVLLLAAQQTPKQYALSRDQEEWVQRELDRLLASSAIKALGNQVERPTGVVANVNEYDNRYVAPASSPSIIYQRDFRRSGTMEKPELAVCGSKNKAWDVYRDFCEVMDLRALSSEVDTLVSFIVWLDLTQSFSGCMDVLAAVSRAHLEAQLADPSKEYRVKRVYRALLKGYRKAKDPDWPRDPLT